MKSLLLFTALLVPLAAFSQKKADRKILDNLQQHFLSLNADSVNSNTSGTNLPTSTAYLVGQFQAAGFSPVNNTYQQVIIHDQGKSYSKSTSLYLNNSPLEAGKDFIPLSFSAQGAVGGNPLIAVQEQNQPWIIDLNNYLDTAVALPDSQLVNTLYELARQGEKDKATAILFYRSSGTFPFPALNTNEKADTLTIPVVYLNRLAADQYLGDPTASVGIRLNVAFSQKKDTGYNVIGSINNGALSTVVIAANETGDKAGLIELGRLLKNDKHFSKENYLLVAFAGEGNGISGEDYFISHPVVDVKNVSYVIYMDRTGCLDSRKPVLLVSGIHTYPQWKAILDKVKDKAISIQPDSASEAPSGLNLPALVFSGNKTDSASVANEFKVVKYLAEVAKAINKTAK